MGWTFYDIASVPAVYDIVWCKWPRREDRNMPGPTVRPVLVREAQIREQNETKFGAVLISYASGEGINATSRSIDLCIEDWKEVKAAGLHKPTRFSLSPADRKWLPWCEEYFVSPNYVKNAGLVLGKLTDSQRESLRSRLKQRGLLHE